MTTKCPNCQFDNPDTVKFCGDCGTQLFTQRDISATTKTLETPIQELTRGSTFAGRYEIIEELGKGGMGKVYRVEDTKAKEEIALKLINPEIAADKKTIERFRNELTTTRKIRHKNICGLYDLGEDKDSYYITMEYVPGEDLKSFLRRSKKLTVETTVSIGIQICDGLAEAHGLGVVHRDLKPSNIMIDKVGNARIMDFGIARSLKGKGITGAGVMIGTPEYMSPEQVEGKDVDHRSDIYSLGVILYEMVTGQVPFDGDTPLSIAHKHKYEAPQEPNKVNTQISDDLNSVILKCLEKDKEKRFQSAEELNSDLNAIEEGIPTTEREVPKKKPLTSKEITVTFGLKKLLFPVSLIVALVVALLILWHPWAQQKIAPITSDKPSLAILYFKNNTGDQSLDHWRSALSDWLITDLTQSKYIRVLRSNQIYTILQKHNLLEAENYTLENIKTIASEGRANHILLGRLTKAGDTFRLDYELQNTLTGELVGTDSVKGNGEAELPNMVDEVTRLIKANLNLTLAQIEDDIDEEVATITTSSPEAYKYYVEASRLYRMGEHSKARELYEKAVAHDPDFALAYRDLAGASIRIPGKLREYIQKAYDLRDKVSLRERLRIEGDFLRGKRRHDEAEKVYKELLELYPDDWIGNNSYAFIYFYREDWEKAAEIFEINVNNKVEAVHSYVNVAKAYEAMGAYQKAEEVIAYCLNNVSSSDSTRTYLVYAYLFKGKYDLALLEAEKIDPNFFRLPEIMGNIYFCKGDLITAEKEYRKSLTLEEKSAIYPGRAMLMVLFTHQGRYKEAIAEAEQGLKLAKEADGMIWEIINLRNLAYIYLRLGKLSEALRHCGKAVQLAKENMWEFRISSALRLKGLIHLKRKEVNEALKIADELNSMDKRFKVYVRDYSFLLGEIELEKKNYSRAIGYSTQAVSLLPHQNYSLGNYHAMLYESLARAYFMNGDLENSLKWHREILSLKTSGKIHGYSDIYPKSFYMLGKIYEQQGNTTKAIEHYKKFLDLWKDADPGIVEVEDARERLAGLK